MRTRLGLVLFGLVGALCVLEVALRLIGTIPEVENPLYSFHQSDENLGWIGVPDIRQRFVRRGFDALIEHTAAGFRRPDPPTPQGAPENVLILGDSFTWGWGVGQGEVFTDRLQQLVGPRVAIHNRGVNAFGTSQELLLLRRELERRHYDEVVLIFINNDFRDNLDGKSGRRPYFDLEGGRLVPRNQPPTPLMSPVRHLWKRSFAISWIDHRVGVAFERLSGPVRQWFVSDPPATSRPTGDRDPASPAAVEVTAALLQEMRRLCIAHGARFTVVISQTFAPRRQLIDICRREGLECLDLAPALWENEHPRDLRLPGDEHWSAYGHRTIADLLLASGLFSPGFASGSKRTRFVAGTSARQELRDDGRTEPDPEPRVAPKSASATRPSQPVGRASRTVAVTCLPIPFAPTSSTSTRPSPCSSVFAAIFPLSRIVSPG